MKSYNEVLLDFNIDNKDISRMKSELIYKLDRYTIISNLTQYLLVLITIAFVVVTATALLTRTYVLTALFVIVLLMVTASVFAYVELKRTPILNVRRAELPELLLLPDAERQLNTSNAKLVSYAMTSCIEDIKVDEDTSTAIITICDKNTGSHNKMIHDIKRCDGLPKGVLIITNDCLYGTDGYEHSGVTVAVV